jgi:multidrug efflux system outer membrane protein
MSGSMHLRAGPVRLLAIVGPAIVSGCMVGPSYHRPKVEAPPTFRFAGDKPSAASVADLPWWEVFRDQSLQALLRRALENNFDLRVALAHVEEARAQARAAGVRLLPTVGAMGAALYSNGSVNAGGSSLYAGGALVSWEPDVFGGLRRAAQEADAQYLASEEARRGVWLTVLADVAQTYFELLSLDVQREVSRSTIKARQETLELYQTQLNGGVATGLEVSRAEADVYGAQATLESVEQQIAAAEDSISLFLGQTPGPVARGACVGTLAPPPTVPAGLPSSLLARRPDVRQAEALLVAANAHVGVQTANLFPTFPLTASAGLLSLDLQNVAVGALKGWAYSVLGLANWTAPVLGSPAVPQLDAAKAAKTAAAITYEKTVFTALREVSDALEALERLHAERLRQEQQVASLTRAVDIASSQFRGGKASYLDVVSAQENEFAAALALAQIEGQQLGQFVQLYRALGGGWWVAAR